MDYEKRKKDNRCKAQNMPEKASTISAANLILLHYCAGAFVPGLGNHSQWHGTGGASPTEPFWVENTLESFLPSWLVGGERKRGRSGWMCTDSPRLELEVYFSVEILWAIVFSFRSTYNLQVHCGLNGYLFSTCFCSPVSFWIQKNYLVDLLLEGQRQ